MTERGWALALASALCLLASAAHAAPESKPSFDCKAARSDTENAICANPTLGALDLRIATAYQKAMAGLDPAAQAALQTDQRYFLAARDDFYDTPYYDLKGDLTNRARMLEAIVVSPRPGWDGAWANVMGEITIAPGASGHQVTISTTALTQSQPTCDFEAAATLQGDTLVAGGDAQTLRENEGWSVRLTRAGASLGAELLPPKTAAPGGPPFCGNIPSIAGSFLPVRSDHGPHP